MMEHLGGAETPEKMAERQARYERPGSGMFKIVDDESGAAVGSVGYWEREWHGETVHEVGWLVIPEFQGRGRFTRSPPWRTDRRTRSAASSASPCWRRSVSSTRRGTGCAAPTGVLNPRQDRLRV